MNITLCKRTRHSESFLAHRLIHQSIWASNCSCLHPSVTPCVPSYPTALTLCRCTPPGSWRQPGWQCRRPGRWQRRRPTPAPEGGGRGSVSAVSDGCGSILGFQWHSFTFWHFTAKPAADALSCPQGRVAFVSMTLEPPKERQWNFNICPFLNLN